MREVGYAEVRYVLMTLGTVALHVGKKSERVFTTEDTESTE